MDSKKEWEVKSNISKSFGDILIELSKLGLDKEDMNFKGTPERFANVMVEFVKGCDSEVEIKELFSKDFDSGYEGMVFQKDICAFSLCPHHFSPVEYKVTLAYIPRKRVVGLSKLSRAIKLLAKQPILQEEFVKRIADTFEKYLKPQGIAVILQGRHFCMVSRGVKENVWTISSELRGAFKDNPMTRNEFMMFYQNGGVGK